jgi:hypothetical protein
MSFSGSDDRAGRSSHLHPAFVVTCSRDLRMKRRKIEDKGKRYKGKENKERRKIENKINELYVF